MPAEQIVNQVFSSTDFLLKKREEKMLEVSKLAPQFAPVFKAGTPFSLSSEVTYMAIDGTESMDSRYDLLVFYAGAFGYAGKLIKGPGGRPLMGEESSIDIPTEISMAVPMHEGDVVDVLEAQSEVPSDFPPLLMELSELALARSVTLQGVDLLLMDRSLSLEYSHLSADSLSFLSSHQPIFLDPDLARIALYIIPSPNCPPRLGPQLAWWVMNELERGRGSWEEVAEGIGLPGKGELTREAISLLEAQTGLKIGGDGPSLQEKYIGLEGKLEAALGEALDHLLRPRGDHPLWKGDKWVNGGEIKLISLLTLRSLLKVSLDKKTLLIGIVKESSSTDFMSNVCAALRKRGRLSVDTPRMGTDVVYLSALSDALGLKPPWRTLEFDAHLHSESTPPGVFAKGYFRLVSSHLGRVFQYDRPFYSTPPVDDWVEGDEGWEGDGFSDRVISYLEPMGNEAIPEALGYNYPLFLADKKAKTVQAEARRAYLSAIDLELSKSGLPTLGGKYRDVRKYYEQMRRKSSIV